jgi:hypothetical protein
MKWLRFLCFCFVWFGIIGSLLGQGFVNLDFETTVITAVHFPAVDRYIATVPGWGPLYNGADPWIPDTVSLNEIAMDGAATTLHRIDSPYVSPIQGNYSLFLQSGSRFYPNHSGESIGQTGQIPSDARSVSYCAAGFPLQVSFNGKPISASALKNEGRYIVYGADISQYAGQTGQLTFNRPYTGASGARGPCWIIFGFRPVKFQNRIAYCLLAWAAWSSA